MEILTYFAGFGPKDLMILGFLPGLLLLLLFSIVFAFTRKGRPYMATVFLTPLVPIMWYSIDKFLNKRTDKTQSILLWGFAFVVIVYAISSTSLFPATTTAVNIMTVIANIIALTAIVRAWLAKES